VFARLSRLFRYPQPDNDQDNAEQKRAWGWRLPEKNREFCENKAFLGLGAGRKFLERIALAPADKAKLGHGTADALLKLKVK
jgi:hypothetical protein